MSRPPRLPLALVLVPALAAALRAEEGEPALPVPTPAQARWQDLELGIFFHFGINTFHSVEWSDGTLDPRTFHPRQLDAGQWVEAARSAGARYVVLTAKHHDGFCLWPTRTTSYSVRSSPWKDGRGDVVKEVSEACARRALGFGVYLSPWDRHEPSYSDAAVYDDFYARQMEELLTGYGPLVEVWLDGAGSEGRKYDWARIMGLIRKHQPEAMVFNMGAPTIRWSGNERGFAPEPCWNVVREEDVLRFSSGKVRSDGQGTVWLPVECDVPIRAGWFWRPDGEKTLKSIEELLVIHHRSVGRGANLLLNVAPDDRGLLPEADVERLVAFGKEARRPFETSVAATRGQGEVLDLDLKGEWIDHLVLAEDLSRGERIRRYRVEALMQGRWKEIARGDAVGHKRIHQLEPLAAEKLRMRVLEAKAPPVLREISVFRASEPLALRAPAGEALEDLSRAIRRFPAFAPYHALRARLLEESDRLEEALRDLDLAVTLDEHRAPWFHQRANVLFKRERFQEALRDHDRAAKGGGPHDEESCWERGLVRYYLGDFGGGRKQFEGYHRFDALDIENGLWRYLCIAEKDGLEKAREGLLDYPQRVRKPFPALLALYSGSGTVEDVLKEATDSADPEETRHEKLFYAHYYLGKHFEVRRDRENALLHLKEALSRRIPHFMWWCARIDLRRLEAAGRD